LRETIGLISIDHDDVEESVFEAKSRCRAVEITETCDARVSGDPELLYSAVENVVRNAVRHTRAKSYSCWITRRGCTLAWNPNQASPGGTGGKRRHPRGVENTGIRADKPEAQ